MLNRIWLGMMTAGVVTAAFNGRIDAVTAEVLKAAESAVQVSFDLIGVMALWLGLMKIAENAGLTEGLARLLSPALKKLFPGIPEGHPAFGAIIMNLSANVLGLGNAATPFGMKAMQELQKLNGKDTASDAMCTFLALNTSCITLLPATIIGVRVSFNSQAPAEITGPCIFATVCSTLAAVSLDAWFRRLSARRKGKNSC